MPEVGLMIWDNGAERPKPSEVDYAIVPRIGDLVDLPGPDGKASAWRVFEVVLHPKGGPLAADVHVECVSGPMTTCTMFIADNRKADKARGAYPYGEPPPIVL